ncbi:putative membrane protein [Leucobacter exalbidus]|uniref:Membrane protein n=1 Tax=Leucobacter exalbidus TaxID=662960 RepID=A0A940PXD2_9MICO|nr:YibE/F family protein [Leucobacter exalbidus]MBP1325916.1 putative membrane protein [Leucobacter exalbidus]
MSIEEEAISEMEDPTGRVATHAPVSGASPRKPRYRALHIILVGIVALLVLGTASLTYTLWPDGSQIVDQPDSSTGGGEIIAARVIEVSHVSCAQPGTQSPNQVTGNDATAQPHSDTCVEVRAELPIGEPVTFSLNNLRAENTTVREGDQVNLIAHEIDLNGETETIYSFYNYPRGGKLLTVAIIFVVIVIAVGRWRGALALIGVGASIALLTTFILPAILAGKPALLVAVAGAIGIMVIVLYLAHGFSHRTTAALFGSIFGILFTAGAGFAVTRWLRFSGIGSTEDASLLIAVPGVDMNDVLTATIVIAGLGILNDITVAQASAVWEMRALNPHLSKQRIYVSAMRVGRDHIASSIYTLVFAYAGSMLVVLLLLYTYPRDLIDLVTSEQIGQEIIRTLIGAAGLVLSMPITTGLAVLFARETSTPSHAVSVLDGPEEQLS